MSGRGETNTDPVSCPDCGAAPGAPHRCRPSAGVGLPEGTLADVLGRGRPIAPEAWEKLGEETPRQPGRWEPLGNGAFLTDTGVVQMVPSQIPEPTRSPAEQTRFAIAFLRARYTRGGWRR